MRKISLSSSENGNIKSRSFASKDPAVSALQDLLFYQLTGIGFYLKNSLAFNKTDKNINKQISGLLYLCNKGINFDINTMINGITEADILKNRTADLYSFLCKKNGIKTQKAPLFAKIVPGKTLSQMVSQANILNAQKSIKASNLNIFAIKELLRLSLYSDANYLEQLKKKPVPFFIYSPVYELLNFLGENNSSLKECAKFALLAGELHFQILKMVISSYEKIFGVSERKIVSSSHKKGYAILTAGEDFNFLKNLLEETKNEKINIYTYGALNYAHSFPEINKYKNLAGIYVGNYCDFGSNIEDFPGIVVITSGNLEELTDIYRGRIFSTENISMLGISKADKTDFKPLINAAYDAPGFLKKTEYSSFEIGFGKKELNKTISSLYKDLSEKKLSKILIFLGCNYCEKDKTYLKNLVKTLPKNTGLISVDCMLLHAKNNKKPSHFILNLGQYLNVYILIKLLFSLSEKFRKNINELPFEITVNLNSPNTISALLMLLSAGIKNIKINSELPNYQTNALLKSFSKNYNLTETKSAKNDTQIFLKKRA